MADGLLWFLLGFAAAALLALADWSAIFERVSRAFGEVAMPSSAANAQSVADEVVRRPADGVVLSRTDLGQLAEAELTALSPVVVWVLVLGERSDSTEWMRGRIAPWTVHPTSDDAIEYAGQRWAADRVAFLKAVPALAFHSRHGAVVVVDLWGDGALRTLARRDGRHLLTLGTPLGAITRHLRAQSPRRSGASGEMFQLVIRVLGWQSVDFLSRSTRLYGYGTVALGSDIEWIREYDYAYDRADVRRVMRAFREINAEDSLDQGAEITNAAAADWVDHEVSWGLAEIEAFLQDPKK